MIEKQKVNVRRYLGALAAVIFAANVQAAPLDMWADGWTMIDDDDGVSYSGYVDPGWGGQDFDAEYLFYRQQGNVLSLGIQAGYNLESGTVTQSWHRYYAGDLALGVDGSYDYAIDFGLLTKDYSYNKVEADSDGDGVDAAGLYAVSEWNNNIVYSQSSPFAMDAGTYLGGLLTNEAGYDSQLDSYFRIVSIDLNDLALGSGFDLDVHWTMSCGNDALDGSVSIATVPEPWTGALLVVGLIGLWSRRRQIDG